VPIAGRRSPGHVGDIDPTDQLLSGLAHARPTEPCRLTASKGMLAVRSCDTHGRPELVGRSWSAGAGRPELVGRSWSAVGDELIGRGRRADRPLRGGPRDGEPSWDVAARQRKSDSTFSCMAEKAPSNPEV
jgi:hypothetical protein